jgi:hypothetical protein
MWRPVALSQGLRDFGYKKNWWSLF